MLTVYIESDQEVISFCEHLFRHTKNIEINWKTNEEWGNEIQFETVHAGLLDTIAKAMVDVFINHRLGTMIKQIIEDFYYYSNPDEIERIHDLTTWIYTGGDSDSLQLRKSKVDRKKDPSKLLNTLFIASMKNTADIHYESIVTFRLKSFKDELIHYVGIAIDEFKREEDHQSFINMLREYIAKKEALLPVIHIIQGTNFTFYKESGKPFTNMELRILMQKEPLYIVGLDENEMNLSPLIAMTPKKIKIYGDDPSEPKTLTVINVFQEKVEFQALRHFPFTYSMKKERK
ncbi:putative sporulation protein YtxC [Oceanobacillus chungangensis]|uniref:Putative sporulation protein YtxC n=1 Tax=Oceanobacillus chungangensis TaxID=1229152 RepID=A0A3D8PZI6_9BACI|nr:putative sporulation protein YtxC [Oceanobacillus chungangensis]RDW21600.1 putative sporulation protein YtxC [Oceanobacillus chungangensis]